MYKYVHVWQTCTNEIKAETFINMVKDIHLQVPEAQDTKQYKLKESHI